MASMKNTEPSLCSRAADMCVRLLGLIFLALGVLKMHALFYPEGAMREYLGIGNPILSFVPNRIVLLAAAFGEIMVGIYSYSRKSTLVMRSGLLLWFSFTALAYKLLLALVQYHGPCGCLLGINRFIPLSIGTQNWLADIIGIAAFLVSLPLFAYAFWRKRACSFRSSAPIAPN